jgi:hypothetical protein
VFKIQHPAFSLFHPIASLADPRTVVGSYGYVINGIGTMKVDAFAVYFSYLFLAGAALAVLMSVKYLQVEREDHGEFYALILFSVIGMLCMAMGMDVVLIFIGLELMAISTYVLVGFLRRGGLQHRHLGGAGVVPIVLLVLRGVHLGVVGHDHHDPALYTRVGQGEERVRGDVEADVLHGADAPRARQ